jgi:hypothetical protein
VSETKPVNALEGIGRRPRTSGKRGAFRLIRAAGVAPLCALIGLPLAGCLMLPGHRTPNLVATMQAPDLPAPLPRIRLVLHHVHTMDDGRAGPTANNLSYDEFVSALGRVRARTPFLAESGEAIPEPDYVLDLGTEIAERGGTSAFISGLTLLIVPSVTTSDAICRATLKTPAGRRLASFEAIGTQHNVMQILLLPLTPFLLAVAPRERLYEDTLEDIMIEVAMYLSRNPLPVHEAQP